MITTTAPGKATQQHCERLRPRGLEGCIIQVPPVVIQLRHAKVLVSRQYPRKKPVVACIRPRIALFGVFSPRVGLFGEMYVDGVFCCCCGP